MSNLHSVYHAVKAVDREPVICRYPEDLSNVDKIIFPGVGAFKHCMSMLSSTGLTQALDEFVIQRGKYILGICLGMQVMAKKSFEGGSHNGLGWFDAVVEKIIAVDKLCIPHMGWNRIHYTEPTPLLRNISHETADLYFVHSYHMRCKDKNIVKATCHYGSEIVAIVHLNNIYGVQFHPEKSQDIGLQILTNFINLDK